MSNTYQVLNMVTAIDGLQKETAADVVVIAGYSGWSYLKPYVAF